MPLNLIEKTCVRITIKDGEEIIGQGSGVMISYMANNYILTAFHCLGETLPEIKNIYIEKQKDYKSDFEIIKVISITCYDKELDWALLEIEFEDTENILENCKLGKNFLKDEETRFVGYQNITKKQFRPFDGKILLLSTNTFQIKLLNDTFQQSSEDGQYVAQGLSGSGVYIVKNKKPFLIGILNSVKDEKAWHDDIECCSVSCLSDVFKEIEDLSNLKNLKELAESLEKEKTLEDIENYKSINNREFDNLLRKNKVIYDTEEDANKFTQKQLLKYLSLKETINQLENKYPPIYTQYQNIAKRFQDAVEEDYSKQVKDNNEAKDSKITLHRDLKSELEDLFPKELKIDVADYQVIEWLLDCSLNFSNK
jgi:hypothetical protein